MNRIVINAYVVFMGFSLNAFSNTGEVSIWKAPAPLVEVFDGGLKRGSDFFKNMQDTLLRMNDYSYHHAKKDRDQRYLKFEQTEHDRLIAEGWKIKSFQGLEGRYSTFGDTSGIVAYHPEKNVIAVIYHGTAGNSQGWETNLDCKRIKPQSLLKTMSIDLSEFVSWKLSELKADVPDFGDFLEDDGKSVGSAHVASIQTKIESLNIFDTAVREVSTDLQTALSEKAKLFAFLEKNGTKLVGTVHSGFAKKYYSSKEGLLELLVARLNKLDPEKKKRVKIVFSGHSQGGGTSSIAVADIAANHGNEMFGPSFSNKVSGNFFAYLISAARAGDQDFVEWLHEIVGKDYIARQNVQGDPVPVASMDKQTFVDLQKSLQKVPIVGALLIEFLKKRTGYADGGHLLLDHGHEAWERAQGLYQKEDHSLDDVAEFDDAVSNATSLVIQEKAPTYLVSSQGTPGFFKRIVMWINTARFAGKVALGLLKAGFFRDERILYELADSIMKRYAHLHYGRYRGDVGAVFDPSVVSRNIDQLLQNGIEHELAKNGALPRITATAQSL